MKEVPLDQALKMLTKEVAEDLPLDEVVEVHNELFPDHAVPELNPHQDKAPLVKRIIDHINGGREPEEVRDLWSLIFTKHRRIWYNEEENTINYIEDFDPVLYPD
jgi:hypothetical protein